MSVLNNYRRVDGQFKFPRGHDNTGLKEHLATEQAAQEGSRALLEKLNSSIFKFAWRYRIDDEEARHLLLNTGVHLPDRRAA